MTCPDCKHDEHEPGKCTKCNCGESELVEPIPIKEQAIHPRRNVKNPTHRSSAKQRSDGAKSSLSATARAFHRQRSATSTESNTKRPLKKSQRLKPRSNADLLSLIGIRHCGRGKRPCVRTPTTHRPTASTTVSPSANAEASSMKFSARATHGKKHSRRPTADREVNLVRRHRGREKTMRWPEPGTKNRCRSCGDLKDCRERVCPKCRMALLKSRFDSRYVVNSDNGCWEWSGALTLYGYGRMRWALHEISAYRLSWRLFRGPIPNGSHVLHRCDNRRCVNPDHLFLGTHQDNMTDMKAKGRKRRGADHYAAKLSAEAVKTIRASDLRNCDLAREFQVDPSTISHIKRGKIWS